MLRADEMDIAQIRMKTAARMLRHGFPSPDVWESSQGINYVKAHECEAEWLALGVALTIAALLPKLSKEEVCEYAATVLDGLADRAKLADRLN